MEYKQTMQEYEQHLNGIWLVETTNVEPTPVDELCDYTDTDTDTDMSTPQAVFVLSEHHWYAAQVEMAREKTRYTRAGHQISLCSECAYFLTRENTTTRKATQHSVYMGVNGTQEHTETTTLPIATKCIYKIKPRKTKSGKGANRKCKRCKNKCWDDYCHVHVHIARVERWGPCTYIT